ncbi:MAG: hypothetical protein UT61_C0025G0005 [Candidatus Woesebacteria bacterium GW2011_GWA1_39_8]|uniref:Uncharacterized protein n=1 Tax=Candidatus Woesebacteria bacterium GW2011_GWA1_39_8 TaxID=1618552 RepID=A0A0G0PP53_9BACT|nr:MAG: hypothetical protein UT61_C0025G0005 [Candidatus Woesebacteria bacterium GW2011_GWA1_39_8]
MTDSRVIWKTELLKLDFRKYGNLPNRELLAKYESDNDYAVLIALRNQLRKLKTLRKNLFALDKYIQAQTKENLSEWLQRNKIGISEIVSNKIGGYNNSTGGISAYFLNLQKYYDEEEVKYSDIESNFMIPKKDEAIQKKFAEDKKERDEKRQNRFKVRKLLFRDLEKGGKGYLVVEFEEPQRADKKQFAADENEKPKEVKPEISEKLEEQIKQHSKKTAIYLAGSLIIITIIGIAIATSGKK